MSVLEEFETKVALVRDFMSKNPDAGHEAAARSLGMPATTFRRALARAKEGVRGPREREVVSEVRREPPTLDGFLEECRVDLKRERVVRHVINHFDQGSKDDAGNVTVVRLFQIKVWLEPVKGADDAVVVKETMDWIRQHSPVKFKGLVAPKRKPVDDEHMLEVSIVDLHVGKLSWAEETGDNYDSKIASSLHQQAAEGLWQRASAFPITKVVLLLGNDFFNVNSGANTTLGGTPQSEDDRWARTWRLGIAILHRAIEFYRTKVDDVEVRFIRGNHDSERIFMAGDVIRAMYDGVQGVTVINDIRKRQYMRWGDVLLGWTHGDQLKLEKLPLIMAGEAVGMWDTATWREIHCGHFHHAKQVAFHLGAEQNSVRVRVLPSLTAADVWHSDSGFVSQKRAAEAYVWAKKSAYVGHVSWSPPSN